MAHRSHHLAKYRYSHSLLEPVSCIVRNCGIIPLPNNILRQIRCIKFTCSRHRVTLTLFECPAKVQRQRCPLLCMILNSPLLSSHQCLPPFNIACWEWWCKRWAVNVAHTVLLNLLTGLNSASLMVVGFACAKMPIDALKKHFRSITI